MLFYDFIIIYSRALVFTGAYISSFLAFFISQYKHKSLPFGFDILAYQTDDICYHIERWIYTGAITSIILVVIWLAEGAFNHSVLLYIGLMLGVGTSDLFYSNFDRIKENCFIHLGEKIYNDTVIF